MEKMEQQPIEVKKITKVNSFLLAIGLAFLFLIICLPVLKDASNFSYEEKTAIGNINMWRVVVGFGILSVLTSAYLFFKKKGHKFTILFLWIFWLIGFLLTYRMGSFHLNSDSIDTQSLGAVGTMRAIIAFVPTLIWFFGIYYCRRIAINLNMNKAVAVLVGIFIPYVSLLIYFLFSFHKKEKQQKVKLLKIIGGTIVIIALISAGAFYYISGTPEYSLYKLKQAIIKNDINGIEKYFYSGNIAKKNNEIPSQFQKELVSGLNASFWEIKETNSDTSKTAEAYVSTGLTGNKLENASLVFSKNSEPLILLKLNDEGAKLYAEITKRNIVRKRRVKRKI